MKQQLLYVLTLVACLSLTFTACGKSNKETGSRPTAPAVSGNEASSVPGNEAPAIPGNEAPAADQLTFTPGTYEGESQGYGGPLKIKVAVTADAIQSVNVVEHQETQGIGTSAIDHIPNEIVAKQSLAVDAVSGCTVTSNAILEATANALEGSGADVNALKLPKGDEIPKSMTTQVLTARPK